MRVEIRQVRYFLAVVDSGTFSAAALQLFVAQSSVSEQVARLERSLGVVLLDRSGRRARLTGAGQTFVPAARDLIAAHDAARAAVRPATVPWRVAPASGRRGPLHRALRELTSTHPGLAVQVHDVPVVDRVADVRSGRLDAAVVHGEVVETDGLVVLPLPSERVYALLPVGHRLTVGPGAVRLTDVEPYPLFVGRGARASAHLLVVVAACRSAGFEPDVRTARSSVETAVATSADGWSYLLGAAIGRAALADLGLVRRALRPVLTVPAGLVTRVEDLGYARTLAAALTG